jgi:hypothetical protein
MIVKQVLQLKSFDKLATNTLFRGFQGVNLFLDLFNVSFDVGRHCASTGNPSARGIRVGEAVTFFINYGHLSTTFTFVYNWFATSIGKRTAVSFHQKAFISFSNSLANHVLISSMG